MSTQGWSKKRVFQSVRTILLLLSFAFIVLFLWIYPKVNEIMEFAGLYISYKNSIWFAFIFLPLCFLALFALFSGNTVIKGRVCRLRGRWFSIGEMLQFQVFFFLLLIASLAFFTINLLNQQYHFDGLVNDGDTYRAMAISFFRQGEFFVPAYSNMPNVEQSVEIVYSRHMSPLYPIYLSAFLYLGSPELVFHVAYFTIFVLSIVVVYLATRDLYGSKAALATCAIVASIQPVADYIAAGYSEAMALIVYTLTIWAVIRSIKTEHYIIYAGLFAGLGYLTRSSIGYFLIIAGVMGFLWRFYYMRWKVLKNRSYLLAIAIFFSFIVVWAVRNIARFWDGTFQHLFIAWQTDLFIGYCLNESLHSFNFYLSALLMKGIFFTVMIFGYSWMILPHLKESIRQVKDEKISGLWLAFLLPNVISLFVVSAFYVVEADLPWVAVFWLDNLRYVSFTFVPMFWIAFEMIRRKEAE